MPRYDEAEELEAEEVENKAQEAQGVSIAREDEGQHGTVLTEIEEIQSQRKRYASGVAKVGRGLAAGADVVDILITPEATDFIPGFKLVKTFEKGGKVYKKFEKLKDTKASEKLSSAQASSTKTRIVATTPSRAADYKSLMSDVDKWALRPVSDRQKQMIKDKLGTVKQRSKRITDQVRAKGFSQKERTRLIKQWEKETGQSWPQGATPHHVIPLKSGGSNEWWNLIPVKNPHTGTIHGKNSALRNELPYSIEPGTISELK